MFHSKSRTARTDGHMGVTILSKGSSFTGTLYCRGISRIGGNVDGGISSEGTLIIEQDAEIIADIKADILIIQGSVKGKVTATKKTELLKTSRLDGELSTPLLEVEHGSCLNATLTMSDSEPESTKAEPAMKLVHSVDSPKLQDKAGAKAGGVGSLKALENRHRHHKSQKQISQH